jgi:hypothetical protein
VTAEQRRAAGEAEFRSSRVRAAFAHLIFEDFATGVLSPSLDEEEAVEVMLRAIVLQALLDPGTWWQPGIAPPREAS